MGAGRKTKTLHLKDKASPAWTVNCSAPARNLSKSELAGVIFGCKHNTFKECIFKQLFGLPAPHYAYVKNINPGLTVFLFNYSDRMLHGIFEAASPGQMNINPYGWTANGNEDTPYPAQVRVRVKKQCNALHEDQFGPIITKNYYESKLFYFELDRTQTESLIKLFSSTPYTESAPRTENAARWNILFNGLPAPNTIQAGEIEINQEPGGDFDNGSPDYGKSAASEASMGPEAVVNPKPERTYASVISDSLPQKKWSSLFKTSSTSDPTETAHDIKTETWSALSNHSHLEWESGVTRCLEGGNQPLEVYIHKGAAENRDEQVAAEDWNTQLRPDLNFLSSSVPEEAVDSKPITFQDTLPYSHGCTDWALSCVSTPSDEGSEPLEALINDGAKERAYLEERCLSKSVIVTEPNSCDLQSMVTKLMEVVEDLKGSQLKQILKISSLEQELATSQAEIEKLKDRCNLLESVSMSSNGYTEDAECETIDKQLSELDDSILIVGGFDGFSWLSTLDCYSPSHDVVKSLSPMTFVRAYASAAKLNHELYIFGGVHDDVWYDTAIVESYNPRTDQWFSQPSLNRRKGSLAGASLHGRIFAIGGGNGVDCFSDVEMLDVNTGRWISTLSMHNKRFAPAAAEMNNALYVAGGYDGRGYLNSAERFDPRERSWTTMGSMSAKRGCHSLVALNEKLYALGGYDGMRMVSSVEVFDSRVGTWIMGEPMNDVRGYAGAVVIGGKIYVIGGVRNGEEILDTIECYTEGHGWNTNDMRALGRRCFFSALVM